MFAFVHLPGVSLVAKLILQIKFCVEHSHEEHHRWVQQDKRCPFRVDRLRHRPIRALIEVREILERVRRTGDRREIEAAIERINAILDAAS